MTATAPMHSIDELRAAANGRQITGLGVSARMRMAVQALNNEGSRNNATIPRQVDVIAGDELVQVNAISGDTIKHAFTDYLVQVIADRPGDEGALPVCRPCHLGDPNRLNADDEFAAYAAERGHSNADVVSEMIRRCTITDVAGLLVTVGNRNAPRRSTIQFGWQLGVPDQVRTGRYTHVKLVPSDPTGGEGAQEGSNLGQNIFTKPASSGAYAFVALCELHRIGRNDITRMREISDDVWQVRASAAVEALLHTIVMPGGAQRNTQLPHLHGVEGALAVSLSHMPPVVYSPLAPDYQDQMAAIAASFGRAGRDHFILPFSDAAGLAELMNKVAGTVRGEAG